MSDINEFDEQNDIEVLRQKNLQEREAFLSSILNDPSFVDVVKDIKAANEERNKNVKKPPIKRKTQDSSFKFTGAVPKQRRSSARLQNKKPEYSHQDLPDEKWVSHDPEGIDDLEEVVYDVKKTRKSAPRIAPSRVIPVEEVTPEMIKNIQTSGIKVYGQDGTSCHQCRQKTVDTKTICRSGFCIGVRGQFCGICVINRYGEDPIKALTDPNWQCYVCRGCCNCSFCRLKQGKRPTGILAPLAKTNGYKSVMDFLQSLKGFGDYSDPADDPENLLGFDGDTAVMGGKNRINIKSEYILEDFKNVVKL